MVPKRPRVKNKDPNNEYSPRAPTTTQRPTYQDSANSGEYVNQRVSYGSFGRVAPTSVVAYDPNVKVATNAATSYFSSNKNQQNLNSPSIKLPNARLKVYG